MAKKLKTARLNLRMTPEQQAKLEKLMEVTDAASMTDTVRRALAVYEHLWIAKKKKQRIIIRDKDGHDTDLMLL